MREDRQKNPWIWAQDLDLNTWSGKYVIVGMGIAKSTQGKEIPCVQLERDGKSYFISKWSMDLLSFGASTNGEPIGKVVLLRRTKYDKIEFQTVTA